jgi:hypothetical protein
MAETKLGELFQLSDRESVARDAYSSEGRSPEERVALFIDLMKTVSAILDAIPPQERERRRRIADQLDPRPDPWWKNFRAEALAEYQCQTSSE